MSSEDESRVDVSNELVSSEDESRVDVSSTSFLSRFVDPQRT